MNRFKQARLQAGLSQKAAAISLGVAQPSMSEWERGKSLPTYDHLSDMADLYHVSIGYLLDREPETQKEQIKKPTAPGDELKNRILTRIDSLTVPELLRLSDFLAGLQASRDIAQQPPAAQAPADQSAE